jgi:hypothetical protein
MTTFAELNGATVRYAAEAPAGSFTRVYLLDDPRAVPPGHEPRTLRLTWDVAVDVEVWKGGHERRTPTLERAADDRLSLHATVHAYKRWGRKDDRLDGTDHGGVESALWAIKVGDFAPGWDWSLAVEVAGLIDRWHGHDLRNRCVHQVELGWTAWCVGHPGSGQPLDAADMARVAAEVKRHGVAIAEHGPGKYPTVYEEQVELQQRPDGSFSRLFNVTRHYWYEPGESVATYCPNRLSMPCPTCRYRCGGEWLHDPIPDTVIERMMTLPGAVEHPGLEPLG